PYPAPMFNPPGISSSTTGRRLTSRERTGGRRSAAASVVAQLALAAAVASCAGAPPPPKTPQAVATQPPPPAPPPPPPVILLPVDVARASVVATVVAPTLEGALDSGLALVRQAVPLPLDKGAVREMALNQLGVPPEIAVQLDLGAPISGAIVASGHGEPARGAFTFTVKAGTDVPKFLSSLGTVTARRGPVWQIQTPRNGEGWFMPVGNVLVFADSEAGMSRAANLALEARRPVKDDVLVVLHSDGLALSSGTDVKTALETFRALIEDRSAASGTKLGDEGRAQLQQLVSYAADVATAEIALDLKPDKGVLFLARLRPRSGSALETVARHVAPARIDPLLVGKSDAGLALTSSYPAQTLEQLQRQRGRLSVKDAKGKAPGKDVVAAGKLLDALIEGLTGSLSMLGRLQPGISFELAYPIKDAASASRIEAALLATDRAAMAALLRPEVTGAVVEMKVNQARIVPIGKRRAASWTVLPVWPNDPKGLMKKVVGAKGLDVYAVVSNDSDDQRRLVFAAGPGAKARLTDIVSGKAQPPAGDVAEAIAVQGGRSLFSYADLREALGFAATVVGKDVDPRVKAVASMPKGPMPIFGGVTGDPSGRVITLDVTVPPSCLAGIGNLVTGVMAAGAAPPAEAPSSAPNKATKPTTKKKAGVEAPDGPGKSKGPSPKAP
ncbi:MAG TPA: hypothetical protein VIU64_06055, partial [Polyangia bacterium]